MIAAALQIIGLVTAIVGAALLAGLGGALVAVGVSVVFVGLAFEER